MNVSVGFQSNATRRQRAERYPQLQPCLNESACVLFKAVKQLVAPTGFLRREKGTVQRPRLGTKWRGKEATPASYEGGLVQARQIGGGGGGGRGVKELVFQQ